MGDGERGGFLTRPAARLAAYGCLLLALAVNITARATRSDSALVYGLALVLALGAAGLFIARMIALDRKRRR
jgi:hypothetical protein